MKTIALLFIALAMLCACATVPNPSPAADGVEVRQNVDYSYLEGARWHGTYVSLFAPLYAEIRIERVEGNKIHGLRSWKNAGSDKMESRTFECEIEQRDSGLRFILRDSPRHECTINEPGELECISDGAGPSKGYNFYRTKLTRF